MKTTKHHFNVFKNECQRLIDRWGITGWNINFFVDEEMAGSHAEVSFDLEYKKAFFWFPKNWTDKYSDPTDEFIKQVALHEVTHFLAARMYKVAESRYVTDSQVTEAYEELARLIENAVKKGI